MIRRLRHALQRRMRAHGVEVRKVPPAFAPLSVFELAVRTLMAQRGASLSFVQVGANDGVFDDPLRRFVLAHGWRGVLVEPQPDVFARLCANYAGCEDRLVFENVAISRELTLTLYAPPRDDTYAASIVSSDPRVVSRTGRTDQGSLRRIEVPALTLDALLARHAITELDLLQIDAEGYDWEVLQTLDLDAIRPALIQLESGHLTRPTIAALARHLTAHGYRVHPGGWANDLLAMRADLLGD